MRNINLTQGTIWKQVLSFALPLFVVNLLQQAYSVSDLIIVGNFSGVDAMAGIGASASLISMIIGLAVGLAMGVSIVTVQAYSREDYDGLYKIVHTGYALAFVTGIALTLVGIFLAPVLLRLMNTPAEILPYAVKYLRIYFVSALPVVIYNIGAGILRGVGDIRHPFLFLSIGIILNIGLDFLFIGVFGWGVAGAAWAYVIAQLVTALLVTFSLATSLTPFRLFLADISFHRGILSKVLRVGVPAGIQAFAVALSNVFIQTAINRFGKHAVAGFSAAVKSDSFVFVLISGLAVAVMTFTSANIGVCKADRVRRGLRQSLVLTFVLVTALSGLIILLRQPIAAAFNPDPQVTFYAMRTIVLLLSMYWIFALTEVIGGAIRGMGNSVFPMVVSLTCMAGFRLLWILVVLPVWHSLDAVIVAYPVSWAVSLVAYLIYLKVKGGIVPQRIFDEMCPQTDQATVCEQKPGV
ncbi:MAG TPA: MATE family efflux transporter [Clostridia bacterium]|nr:MATE family efflux transporter [Clostridia bacterium]